MRVKVKIVVFEHPAPQTFGKFCGYCPATKYFCSGTDVTDISNRITDILMIVLQQRKKFPNYLKKRGWKITENSIESPIFTDKELVQLTESSYVLKINNPIIVELDVKIPQPQELF
ncbi:MAG TPA: hypothetical protein K8V61_03855 [Bacteroides clarus]|uniref:hypothetical protein n=1 Tax=Bacteroides clarus TaxID=626929 RepID=UPI001896FB5E|nr:hypothetical protein [Bacteroides clarus]HJF98411.1 hypothetical protein [Bacteroides clarus]